MKLKMTQLLLGLASFTALGSHLEKLVEQMTADEMSLSAPMPSSPQSWGHFLYELHDLEVKNSKLIAKENNSVNFL